MTPLSWLVVVLGLNATLTARVISWQSVTHMCFFDFLQSHQILFSHAFDRGEMQNMPERKFPSTRSQTSGHESDKLTSWPFILGYH